MLQELCQEVGVEGWVEGGGPGSSWGPASIYYGRCAVAASMKCTFVVHRTLLKIHLSIERS